ncbi:hypothetical protein H4219_003705 [Mycoemilia scoparia]|uniref:Uncharacterized protein n=1 Tax=Mycoemilia scoparia TaxID=417184 RepID=A0A9W7ZU10_9FUNG|nr:hypothetical protein H4219_003705 [Mycoemilia scoparia]
MESVHSNVRESLAKMRIRDHNSDDEFNEILKQQEEFLKSKSKPSAKVIRLSELQPKAKTQSLSVSNESHSTESPVSAEIKQNDNKNSTSDKISDKISDEIEDAWDRAIEASTNTYSSAMASSRLINNQSLNSSQSQPKKKLSLFAQSRLTQNKAAGSAKPPTTNNSANSSTKPGVPSTVLSKLMKQIPEHNPTLEFISFPKPKQETGFPATANLLSLDKNASSNTSSSIFGRNNEEYNFKGIKSNRTNPNKQQEGEEESLWVDKTKKQIETENTTRLSSMTAEQIKEAQDEVRELLSDDALSKLMARINSKATKPTKEDFETSKIKQSSNIASENNNENTSKSVRFSKVEEIENIDNVPEDNDAPPPLEAIDNDDESDEEVIFDHHGEPKNKKSTSKLFTEPDSQFYKDLKEMYYPTEPLEEQKLEWILNQTQARTPAKRAMDTIKAQTGRAVDNLRSMMNGEVPDPLNNPASHIRFGFDGQILESVEANIPVSKGLHHHGDDPDEAGYTIPELLHLCRSKVPAQRSLPLRVLSNVLHKVNTGAYDLPISRAVYENWLVDWEGYLYLVEAWKDRNTTVIMVAVMTTWIWVVEMYNYSTLISVLGDKPDDEINTAANSSQDKSGGNKRPGVNVRASDNPEEPIVAQGHLVEQTFKGYEELIYNAILEFAPEIIQNELIPHNECKLIVEIVNTLCELSPEFNKLLKESGDPKSDNLTRAVESLDQ